MKISNTIALTCDIIALLILWHLVAEANDLSFLPNPIVVTQTLIIELQGELIPHILISTVRILISIGLGTLIAAPLAILAAQKPLIDFFLTPLMYLLYPAPKLPFMPLIILFLGLGNESKIFLIALIIFFQVFVIVRDTAKHVASQTLDSIRSVGASQWQLLRYIYFPISVPAIISALKISIGTAISVLFIVETVATSEGLGFYINNSWTRFAYAEMYAGIAAMSILGMLLFASLGMLERYIGKWRKS